VKPIDVPDRVFPQKIFLINAEKFIREIWANYEGTKDVFFGRESLIVKDDLEILFRLQIKGMNQHIQETDRFDGIDRNNEV